MNDVQYDYILVEQIERVLRITLNRPEKRNALSHELQRELLEVVELAQDDDDIRVIIIRGAGPSFCSGYDIGGLEGAPKKAVEWTLEKDIAAMIRISQNWAQLWNCRVPVIAQVHGYCVAGATDLALHCDMVIAADDAKIGMPPVRSQGSPPTHMWVYNVGPQWAKRFLLTGDTVSGAKAEQIGLVVESVPADQLDHRVLEFATHISNIGHDLLVHNKRIVNFGVELMGRSQLQVLAGMHDALAHNAPEAVAYFESLRTKGVKKAVAERNAPFGDT